MCTNLRGRSARILVLSLAILTLPIAVPAKTTNLSISFSKTDLPFGTLAVGATSTTQVVTVTNSGGLPLLISGISASSAEFAQNNTCGSSLSRNSQCNISISFKPSAAGTRNGSITINDNAPGAPHRISLSGAGVVPVPQVALSSAALQFGDLRVQTQSDAQALTLSNNGSAALAISSISASGDFAHATTCGSSLNTAANCTISVTSKPMAVGARTGKLTVVDNAPGSPHVVVLTSNGLPEPSNGSNISGIWANEGGDKVTRDELRASRHTENRTGTVVNRAWDGTTITLSSARNEVVSFNLVLEAANANAANVAVKFDTLTGPNGAVISSSATNGDGVFNWVGRPIELFFVRYLQIKGLSYFGYYKGDERQIPARFQTPWTGNGNGTGLWTDRPDHDKFYPDIMVPLELVPTFTVAQAENQSIWSDIYVPKNAPAGTYTGTVEVLEYGATTHRVPVSLTVQKFSLPDSPTSKTMVNLDTTDIMWRYVTKTGGYANWASADGQKIANITDKYFELFHRHKIGLIGENECPAGDRPCDSALPRLTGSLYNPAHGYDGPGANTPEGVYSIGTYGTWGAATYGVSDWKHDKGLFQNHIDNYASWFAQNLPNTDYFLYLQDEPSPSEFNQVETWSQWIAQDPGPGKNMPSLSTLSAVSARAFVPTLSIPVTTANIGACPTSSPCDPAATMQAAADFYKNTPGRKFWGYNDGRPGTGTAMTEDDGVSMRTLPWTQYKMGIDRWFYWYANLNTPMNWFQNAATWGSISYLDRSIGQTGNDGTSNGNGLLVYPGTDLGNPSDSYGVNGPIASLRLKEWRRGIQDTDYLALANQIDPVTTKAIVSQAMPKALWENPAPGNDPSYFIGPISWSTNPDDWEAKRAQLAQMINNYCTTNPSSSVCGSN